jgi:hypothetical protein
LVEEFAAGAAHESLGDEESEALAGIGPLSVHDGHGEN